MSRSLILLTLLLLAGIIIPFMIWGERFDAALSLDGSRAWMAAYGDWAWLAGVLLMVADIVMSALGLMYGWLVGGLIAAAGSFLSGIVAYLMCSWLGRPAARWIAGEDGLLKGEELFAIHGGWLVAVSRWMPVLPEAVACLAGLVRMPKRVFIFALACGSLPVGFAFAAIGALGNTSSSAAIALSAVLPAVLWFVARFLVRKLERNEEENHPKSEFPK